MKMISFSEYLESKMLDPTKFTRFNANTSDINHSHWENVQGWQLCFVDEYARNMRKRSQDDFAKHKLLLKVLPAINDDFVSKLIAHMDSLTVYNEDPKKQRDIVVSLLLKGCLSESDPDRFNSHKVAKTICSESPVGFLRWRKGTPASEYVPDVIDVMKEKYGRESEQEVGQFSSPEDYYISKYGGGDKEGYWKNVNYSKQVFAESIKLMTRYGLRSLHKVPIIFVFGESTVDGKGSYSIGSSNHGQNITINITHVFKEDMFTLIHELGHGIYNSIPEGVKRGDGGAIVPNQDANDQIFQRATSNTMNNSLTGAYQSTLLKKPDGSASPAHERGEEWFVDTLATMLVYPEKMQGKYEDTKLIRNMIGQASVHPRLSKWKPM